MTKAELIKAWMDDLANNAVNLTVDQTDRALKSLCGVMSAELLNTGGEISLPGLGKLKTVHQGGRKGRNPQTGQAINVPARNKVKFVEGKELKDALKS